MAVPFSSSECHRLFQSRLPSRDMHSTDLLPDRSTSMGVGSHDMHFVEIRLPRSSWQWLVAAQVHRDAATQLSPPPSPELHFLAVRPPVETKIRLEKLISRKIYN